MGRRQKSISTKLRGAGSYYRITTKYGDVFYLSRNGEDFHVEAHRMDVSAGLMRQFKVEARSQGVSLKALIDQKRRSSNQSYVGENVIATFGSRGEFISDDVTLQEGGHLPPGVVDVVQGYLQPYVSVSVALGDGAVDDSDAYDPAGNVTDAYLKSYEQQLKRQKSREKLLQFFKAAFTNRHAESAKKQFNASREYLRRRPPSASLEIDTKNNKLDARERRRVAVAKQRGRAKSFGRNVRTALQRLTKGVAQKVGEWVQSVKRHASAVRKSIGSRIASWFRKKPKAQQEHLDTVHNSEASEPSAAATVAACPAPYYGGGLEENTADIVIVGEGVHSPDVCYEELELPDGDVLRIKPVLRVWKDSDYSCAEFDKGRAQELFAKRAIDGVSDDQSVALARVVQNLGDVNAEDLAAIRLKVKRDDAGNVTIRLFTTQVWIAEGGYFPIPNATWVEDKGRSAKLQREFEGQLRQIFAQRRRLQTKQQPHRMVNSQKVKRHPLRERRSGELNAQQTLQWHQSKETCRASASRYAYLHHVEQQNKECLGRLSGQNDFGMGHPWGLTN